MKRSRYSYDGDNWQFIRWRGAVNSAIKGARGQEFLRDLAEALDAMPNKRLIANEFRNTDGDFCALGVLGAERGIDMSNLDPYDRETIASAFEIAPALAAEVVFENDEAGFYNENPKARWKRMRQWVESNLRGEIHD